MRAPDLTQRIIGYRQWVVNSRLELKAVGVGDKAEPWKPGPQRAKCLVYLSEMNLPCIPVVDVNCHCGFYALHKLKDAEQYGGYATTSTVQGIVSAWGRVAVHDSGFRAEYAEIVAIICPDEKVEKVEQGNYRFPALYRGVASKYNVPLIEYKYAEEFAREFGAEVPKELYPQPDIYTHRDPYAEQSVQALASNRSLAFKYVKWLERQKDPYTKDMPSWVDSVLEELDPLVPEAMTGLYDLYVPNPGDLLVAVNDPPTPNYISFPPDEVKPTILDPANPQGYGQYWAPLSLFISTSGLIAYLPVEKL